MALKPKDVITFRTDIANSRYEIHHLRFPAYEIFIGTNRAYELMPIDLN